MDEPLDRNKSDLTHNVTALAMAYLENRGFKPIETEVFVRNYGVADVGGIVSPTPTEAARLRLANAQKFGLADQSYGEITFRYGPLLTGIIEVKVSRSDFTNDIQSKFSDNWPAHLCYLAYPKGLIEPHELPQGWMGLEMDSTGYSLRRKHWSVARVHPQHPGDVALFATSLAVRADYRTRYARHRTWWKMYRAGKTES